MIRKLLATLLFSLATTSVAQAQWAWVGTDGPDAMGGRSTHDDYFGLGGDDFIDGGKGDDYLLGGSGSDWLVDSSGSDVFKAQDGECDIIDSRDDGTDPWYDTIDADECDIIFCDWDDILEIRDAKGKLLFEGYGFEYWEWLDGGDDDTGNDG